MMFSATFAPEVQMMATDFLRDYVFIAVGRVGSAAETVQQLVVLADDLHEKVRYLEKAIKDHMEKKGLAVIFVETKRAADDLEMNLYEKGVSVTAIHGDRSQTQREEALHAFKTGQNPVLVATDVAARGLDIPNVALVVNFDMPKQLDDYVHRIGRTGRAGHKGVAIAFVNNRCNYLQDLGHLLREAKQDPPSWFDDLARSAGPRQSKGKGKGENRFGGVDFRDDKPKSSAPKASSEPRPAVNDGWGNSGADDAW
jgi:ATP-dependent RNA helicase DDX3X